MKKGLLVLVTLGSMSAFATDYTTYCTKYIAGEIGKAKPSILEDFVPVVRNVQLTSKKSVETIDFDLANPVSQELMVDKKIELVEDVGEEDADVIEEVEPVTVFSGNDISKEVKKT